MDCDAFDFLVDTASHHQTLIAGLTRSEDRDVNWALALVAFAVGHPAARQPLDLDEVLAAVAHAKRVAAVKRTRYYRIGSNWELYVPVAVVENRVWLFPVVTGEYEVDFAVPEVRLRGRAVSWPRFEPPRLDLLESDLVSERNASGFVAEALAVSGNVPRPRDTDCTFRA